MNSYFFKKNTKNKIIFVHPAAQRAFVQFKLCIHILTFNVFPVFITSIYFNLRCAMSWPLLLCGTETVLNME